MRVDIGSGVEFMGLQKFVAGMGRVWGRGDPGERVIGECGKKERLLDRVFAIEYREVRLKLMLKLGGSVGKGDNQGRDLEKRKGRIKREAFEDCGKPVLGAIHTSSREPSIYIETTKIGTGAPYPARNYGHRAQDAHCKRW